MEDKQDVTEHVRALMNMLPLALRFSENEPDSFSEYPALSHFAGRPAE